MPLLQSRLLYYRGYFLATEAIPALQNRFLYYRVVFFITEAKFFTTESISLLQSRCRDDFFTQESMAEYTVDFFTTESMAVL